MIRSLFHKKVLPSSYFLRSYLEISYCYLEFELLNIRICYIILSHFKYCYNIESFNIIDIENISV